MEIEIIRGFWYLLAGSIISICLGGFFVWGALALVNMWRRIID